MEYGSKRDKGEGMERGMDYKSRDLHMGWGRGGGGISADLIDLTTPTGSARNTPRFGGVAAKCPERLTFKEKI